jgi:hypothetical protein
MCSFQQAPPHSPRMRRLLAVVIAALFFCAPPSLVAQSPAATTPQSSLTVFLDCRSGCDESYFKTELTWVNWVRDREVADIQILITSEGAGANAERLTFAFIGLKSFAGRGDTLTHTTNPTTTSDERRKSMLQIISAGLVPYAARTSMLPQLKITSTVSSEKSGQGEAQKKDPWNAWQFEISLNGFMSGEASYQGKDINMGLEANRVTERWKTNIEYNYSYNDNKSKVQEFDNNGNVTSEETYTNLQRDWNFEWLQVKSMSEHFSLGGQLQVAQQTFRNQDLRTELKGAFEYNLFPYKEATRKELSFRYGLGVRSYRYADTTIFGKIKETVPDHFAEVTFNTRQPWGNVNINLEHRNLLTDASKRTTAVYTNYSVRLFKGFSINGGGGYEWINDQIYLPAESSSAVDVFLRRRALLTSYSYWTHMGISYTFGSIFNNVVNPRF